MSDEKLYSGHTAQEVIELMGMLAAQHEVHSSDEAIAIARQGYALLKDQQSRLARDEKPTVTIDERKRKDFCFHGYAWDEHCIVCDQPERGRGDTSHVCGLEGYNGMIDPPCPGCESEKQPQTWCGEVAGVMDAGAFRCNLPAGHAGEHRHRFRNGSE